MSRPALVLSMGLLVGSVCHAQEAVQGAHAQMRVEAVEPHVVRIWVRPKGAPFQRQVSMASFRSELGVLMPDLRSGQVGEALENVTGFFVVAQREQNDAAGGHMASAYTFCATWDEQGRGGYVDLPAFHPPLFTYPCGRPGRRDRHHPHPHPAH